jgi:hypothetical protein
MKKKTKTIGKKKQKIVKKKRKKMGGKSIITIHGNI